MCSAQPTLVSNADEPALMTLEALCCLLPPSKVNAQTSKGQTALHVAVEMAENQWLNREFDYLLTIKLLLGGWGGVPFLWLACGAWAQ